MSGLTRRALLAGGAALGGLALLPFAAPSPAIALFDPRYGASRRFAAGLAGQGARPLATGRDLARLWHAGLRRETGRLAGLATYADFLVIRGCAAEAGRSLAWHAWHDGRGGGAVRHRVSGDAALADRLSRAGDAWPDVLSGRRPAALLPTSAAPHGDHPGTLVSWLIV